MMHVLRAVLLLVLFGSTGTAHAALSCNFQNVPAISFVAYTPSSTYATAPNALRQVQVTVLCTRTAAGDPTSVALGIDNGSFGGAAQSNNMRRTFSGTNYDLKYDLYSDSSCSSDIRDTNTTRVAGTVASSPLNTQLQVQFNFWACITTAQAMAGYPAGSYSDTIGLVLRTGNTQLATTTTTVSTFAPAVCSFSNGPANLVFTYVGLGATSNFQTSSFNANCTNGLNYTLSVSPTSGVVAGLRYTLGLTSLTAGSSANVGTTSISDQGNATGTRLYYVNGLMAAGQAGQTGAVVPQTHTLTITY